MDPSALGRYLRESRESKELSLDDAVSALRIRRATLEAFERGEFTVVETPVQIRGLLRNYARYLGLGEDLVLHYYETSQRPRRRGFGRSRPPTDPIAPPRSISDTQSSRPSGYALQQTSRFPRGLLRNTMLFMITLLSLAIIGFVIYDTVMPTQLLEPSPIPTQILSTTNNTTPGILIPTSTSIPPTATPTLNVQGLSGVAVRLEFIQRSWVQIQVDGIEQFSGIITPDQSVEFEGIEQISVNAANAAALRVITSTEEYANLGHRGQQVNIEITVGGVQIIADGEPSPTPSPESTATIHASPTAIVLGASSATPVQIKGASGPQPTIETQPTPTSIFDNTNTPQPETQQGEATPQATQQTAEQTTIEQATPIPTDKPSPAAVLPIRATSIRTTPEK